MLNQFQLCAVLCLAGLVIAFPKSADADILALYDFESTSVVNDPLSGEAATSQFPLAGQTSGVSAGEYYTHSNSTVSGTTIGGVASGSNDPHAFARTVTTPTAGTANNPTFHEFSLDVNQGIWSFDSLHFEYWVNDGVANGQDYTATVYSDLTAGTALGSVTYNPTGRNLPDIQTVTINDSNFRSSFQNLAAGTSVNFRLEFSDNVSDGAIVHRVDDVVVRGFEVQQVTATAIPEPAAASMLLLIGTATLIRRRRN